MWVPHCVGRKEKKIGALQLHRDPERRAVAVARIPRPAARGRLAVAAHPVERGAVDALVVDVRRDAAVLSREVSGYLRPDRAATGPSSELGPFSTAAAGVVVEGGSRPRRWVPRRYSEAVSGGWPLGAASRWGSIATRCR